MRGTDAHGRWMAVAGWVAVGLHLFSVPTSATAACLTPPGDVSGDGLATVVDVQCNVLMNLWSLSGQTGPVPSCLGVPGSPAAIPDHNCDGVINVQDTLLVVSFALIIPLSPAIDADMNQCVDACETDLDGDGNFDTIDCAPLDPLVFDGAPEICNGWDDDCDATIDETAAATLLPSCSDDDLCTGIETCSVATSANALVITEIMAAPVAGSQGEYIELYNGTTTAINIRDFQLTDEAAQIHTIDPGGALFVPSKGFLVLAASGDAAGNGGLRANYVYSGFSIPDTGSVVALLDTSGTLLARADTTLAGIPAPSGASVALVSRTADPADPASWAASTLAFGGGDSGTPGGPNRDVSPSTCLSGTPLDCTDADPCTDSACVPATGCETTLNTAPCDDGDACTTGDQCAGGVCVGTAVTCSDDGDPCTEDVCDPASGSCGIQAMDATPCDDGDPCTLDDACSGGVCTGGLDPACLVDGALCTLAGNSGDEVLCEIRLVADELPLASALQLDLSYPAVHTLSYFTDGESCVGAGGGPPCFPYVIPGGAAALQSGHTVGISGGDPSTWSGAGTLLFYDVGDPTNPLTTALAPAGDTSPDAVLITAVFTLGATTPAGSPAIVAADAADAADPDGNALVTTVDALTIRTSGGACAGVFCADDGNPCTFEGCNPDTGLCETTTAADDTPCDDAVDCTENDRCLAAACVGTPTLECDLPLGEALCIFTGLAGDEVVCPVRLAAEAGVAATALQLDFALPDGATLLYFDDGVTCLGPGGTSPCIEHRIPTNFQELQSGHAVGISGANPALWSGGGTVVLADFDDPTNPLTDAVVSGTSITGDSVVFNAHVVLTEDFLPPEVGLLTAFDISAATADGLPLSATVEDLLIRTNDTACVGVACPDDGNPCTQSTCNPASGTCESTTLSDGVPCEDGDACTEADACTAGQCLGALNAACDGPANVVCGLAGSAGDIVSCPVRLAASSPPQATALQFDLVFGSAANLVGLADGTYCIGGGGGPPCLPWTIPAPFAGLQSGHSVLLPGDSPGVWASGARLVVADFADPTNALTDAWSLGGALTGEPIVLEALFELAVNANAAAPVLVSVANVSAADGFAGELGVEVDDLTLLTFADVCAGVICGDDGNPCTEDVCNPATGTCGVATSEGEACDDGTLCTSGDTCLAGACVGTEVAACDDPSEGIVCVAVGASGDTVDCPIRLTAAAPPAATGLELSLSWLGNAVLSGLEDGPGWTLPAPNSTLQSGHAVGFTGGDPAGWANAGVLLVFDLADPTNPVTDAFVTPSGLSGDPVVATAQFTLAEDFPPSAPLILRATGAAATGPQAQELGVSISSELVQTTP